MRTDVHSFRSLRVCMTGLVLSGLRSSLIACLFFCAAHAAENPPSATAAEIIRLQDLSETQIAESIAQLSKLQSSLATDASLSDQRDALIALTGLYLNDDQTAQARKLIAQLAALGVRYNDNWSTAIALNFRAAILKIEGKLDEAKNLNAQALQLAKSINAKPLMTRIYSTASVINSSLGNFQVALQYRLAAMDALGQGTRHDDLLRVNAYNNIGNLYIKLKDPQMALNYFGKGIKLARQVDAPSMLAMLELNTGIVYDDLGRLTEAESAFNESLAIARRLADRRGQATALNNLSDTSYGLGHYAQCLQYAQQTLELANQLKNSVLQADAWVNGGVCRMSLGEVKLGVNQVNQGLNILRNSKAKPALEALLAQVATAYQKAGMYKEAYKTMVEKLVLSTELFHADRDRVVSELQAKYDASQREKQIQILEHSNQIQHAEINNKNLQWLIATLASAAVAIVALVTLFLYRKLRIANRHLQTANASLAHQSQRDPLTGLLNRRAFQDAMHLRTQAHERRSGSSTTAPHALLVLDIDHFKRINDIYGHAAGDEVLVEISKRLTFVMRDQDMLMRWGGEEFLIFLNHMPSANLQQVVERILITIGGRPVAFENTTIQVTMSVGYISLQQGEQSEVDVDWKKSLNLADSVLYMAKTRGRNQAIGIREVHVPRAEFDELVNSDLEQSIQTGKIVIEQIAGPLQEQRLPELIS